jgi:hypothetical protein
MSITTPVTTTAPMIESFGTGGQMYMASIWGGENVRNETILPLFSFRATDNTHENAAQLTNLQEAQKVGSLTITIPLNRTEMADYLCTNRSALSRELSSMKKDGILDYDQRVFHLYNVSQEQ